MVERPLSMREVLGSIPNFSIFPLLTTTNKQCLFVFALNLFEVYPGFGFFFAKKGDVAQMVERPLSMREVLGSIPNFSTFSFYFPKKIGEQDDDWNRSTPCSRSSRRK